MTSMTCRRAVELLIDYVADDLAADQRSLLESHFQRCPPCLIYDSCGFRVFTLSERGAAHDDSVPGQHSPKDNVPSDVPNVLHTFQILSDSLWETSATIFRDLEFPSQGVLTFCVPVLLRFRIP